MRVRIFCMNKRNTITRQTMEDETGIMNTSSIVAYEGFVVSSEDSNDT